MLDAEILGARKALEAALDILEAERSFSINRKQKVFVMMDSQQARKAVLTGITTSSIEEVRAFRTLTQKAQTIVQVRWVPAHSGIQGNVEADAAARAALRRLPNQDVEPELITSAYLHRLMNQRRQALLDGFWEESCSSRYRELDLLMRRRKPPELALPRRLLLELIAIRTGHGDFAAHHRRFNNLDAIMECPNYNKSLYHPSHRENSDSLNWQQNLS